MVRISTSNRFLHYANIPSELTTFVNHETYSLLIRGNPGSGKTTISLTLLKILKCTNNFFYISTRTSPKQLFSYYPWLYSEIKRNDGRTNKISSSNFEDARLDEPESLFERITNQLMDVKSPIIIIDSWDAIASFMDDEARLNNERVLQTWRERAGAKLIFITEDTTNTKLDFLVDGVVSLEDHPMENSRIRIINFEKLRGVKIINKSYFFTLNHGIFQSFDPSSMLSDLFNKSYPVPISNTGGNSKSILYSAELNAELGTIQRNTNFGIIFDYLLGFNFLLSFVCSLLNFLNENDIIIVHIPKSIDTHDICIILRSIFPCKILIFPNDDFFYNSIILQRYYDDIKKTNYRSNIVSIFFVLDNNLIPTKINFFNRVSNFSDISILFCPESKYMQNIFVNSKKLVMMKLFLYRGLFLLKGLNPQTPLFGFRRLKNNTIDMQPIF